MGTMSWTAPETRFAADVLGLRGLAVTAVRREDADGFATLEAILPGCRRAMELGRLCRPDCRQEKPRTPKDRLIPRHADRKARLRVTLIPVSCADGTHEAWPAWLIGAPVNATASAVEAAIRRLLVDTVAETSRQTGFSRETLARLRDSFLERFAARHVPRAGAVMAADGVAAGRNLAATVVADLSDTEHKMVVGVLPGYSADGLATWLETLADGNQVEAFVIDRCKTLRAGIRKVYCARREDGSFVVAIVADRAHLHRNVSDCVLRALRAAGVTLSLGRGGDEDEGEDGQGALRDQVGQLFEKDVADYTEADWKKLARLEDLHRGADGSSPVTELWQINQGFRIAVRSFSGMRAALEGWRAVIGSGHRRWFEAFLTGLFGGWLDEVLAWARFPFATGYIEAVNRFIKFWVAEERGNLRLDMLEARVLFRYGRDEVKALMRAIAREIADDLAADWHLAAEMAA